MKCLRVFASLFFFSFPVFAQLYEAQDVENYIEQYRNVAVKNMQECGIPASITLAQGIIESGAGKSPLAVEANNHFGIKCHTGWAGGTYTYDDDLKNECFRKYDSAMQSFTDHSLFLKNRPRYAVLFTYDPKDYKAWAKGLKSCGYATNPKYAEILIRCIEDYDLHQWDLNKNERADWFAAVNNMKDSTAASAAESVSPDPAYTNKAERIYIFNDIKCVNLAEGESLNQLATAYEISLKRLMRYNDLTNAYLVRPGDRVYLQPKRMNGDEEVHTVKEGETMFIISQQHGIQLEKLYAKNGMRPNTEPAAGELIYLRNSRESPVLQAQNQEEQSALDGESPTDFYTVAKGDTLYSISRKYNLSVEELRRINRKNSDALKPGEQLRVK
jgi:LysM repeat protein